MRRYYKHRQNFSRQADRNYPVYYNESDIYEDEFVRENSRSSNPYYERDHDPRDYRSSYYGNDYNNDDYNFYEEDYDLYPEEEDYAYANQYNQYDRESRDYNRMNGSFNSMNRNNYRNYDRGLQEFRNEQRRLYKQPRRSRRY